MGKKLWIFVIIVSLSITVGCATQNSTTKQTKPIAKIQSVTTPKPVVVDPKIAQRLKITENKDLTKSLLKEKDVIGGRIYLQNGIAVGAAVMTKKTTKTSADKLANKYVSLMKLQFKTKRVTFQVVSNGRNLVSIDIKN